MYTDPRIAISVVEQYNLYNMVSIKGRVIEQTTIGADEHLRKLAQKYLGFGKYYYEIGDMSTTTLYSRWPGLVAICCSAKSGPLIYPISSLHIRQVILYFFE